jgi:hypothetical protein
MIPDSLQIRILPAGDRPNVRLTGVRERRTEPDDGVIIVAIEVIRDGTRRDTHPAKVGAGEVSPHETE